MIEPSPATRWRAQRDELAICRGGAVPNVAALKDKINECDFHCTGEIMPKHVCEPHIKYVDEHVVQTSRAAPKKPPDLTPRTPAGRPAPGRTRTIQRACRGSTRHADVSG